MTHAARYTHTNLVASDWRTLARFYQDVFGCTPVPPERDYAGPALDAGTGIRGARLRGVHLRLPGYGEIGPTLEIFEYEPMEARPPFAINRPGYGHIAFALGWLRFGASLVMKCGDPLHVLLAPATERLQRRIERGAELGHRVLDPRRHLVEHGAVDDTIALQFAQRLDQHLLADPRHAALEFAEATRPGVHLPQDQGLPLASDHLERRNQTTGVALLLWHKCLIHTLLYVPYFTVGT